MPTILEQKLSFGTSIVKSGNLDVLDVLDASFIVIFHTSREYLRKSESSGNLNAIRDIVLEP